MLAAQLLTSNLVFKGVVGGFIITDRMLRMFKGDGGKK